MWIGLGIIVAVCVGAVGAVAATPAGRASAGPTKPIRHVRVPEAPSTTPLPTSVIDAEAATPYPVPPGTTIDATATISTGTFVYADYNANGSSCSVDYFSSTTSVAQPSDTPGGLICLPPGASRPAADLHIDGGQANDGAFILFGSVPATADDVRVTDVNGNVFDFAVPQTPLHTDATRDAFIVDLSRFAISGVSDVSVLAGGKVIGSLPMGG
jgi:hypothetical protein